MDQQRRLSMWHKVMVMVVVVACYYYDYHNVTLSSSAWHLQPPPPRQHRVQYSTSSSTTMMMDRRPFAQRVSGPRPARRFNHGFQHLYRHNPNDHNNNTNNMTTLTIINSTDPLQYIQSTLGLSDAHVQHWTTSFPPLRTMDVNQQIAPKVRFLQNTIAKLPTDNNHNKYHHHITTITNTTHQQDASLPWQLVPSSFWGIKLERILAPRHAFLVAHQLYHGRDLFAQQQQQESSSIGGKDHSNGTRRWDELISHCNKPKQFAMLCRQWQQELYHDTESTTTPCASISVNDVLEFDSIFGRGLLAATRQQFPTKTNSSSHATTTTTTTTHLNLTAADWMTLLLQHGANLYQRDYQGATLLHWAAGTGNYEGVQVLVPYLSIHSTTDRDGSTPLHWAAAGCTAQEFGTGGHLEICQLLLMHSSNPKHYVQQVTKDGNSALMWAAWSGTLDTVKLLVRYRACTHNVNRNGCTVAHWAASGGNLEVCQYLADIVKVDFQQVNHGGNTPLTHAIAFGHANVVEWLRDKYYDRRGRDGTTKTTSDGLTLAQDFVGWTNGQDDRRTQILQLLEEWDNDSIDDATSSELQDDEPNVDDFIL